MPKGRILVVDDQRYFRELLEGLLREADYEVGLAGSGEEALEILNEESFDTIITDLVMPGMDGSDLVHRVKKENPNQDIVVVTGVVDVKTAVDAMKLGADEYLLKPIDESVLTTALDNLARQRAMRDEHASLRAEHASLLQENIEFLGEQTLFARATDLFSCLELEVLAARLLEELCRETQARGAAIWVACDGDASRLSLMATEGSARVEEEPQLLADSEVPEELRTGRARSVLDGLDVPESEHAGLRLALAHRGKLIGLVRLSDKQGGGDFDDIDRGAAEKLARFGEIALNNALRIAALEGGSLQDPATGAYVYEFFQDAVRGEIEKSGRHGRSLSLMKVDLGPLDALRRRLGDAEFRDWMAKIVSQLEGQLRASDILASDGEGRFVVMFPDADEISAAALKYRAARTLERSASFPHLEPGERPARDLAIATYPVDGLQLESLRRVLDTRIESERASPVRTLGLETLPFSEILKTLLSHGRMEREETAAGIARFLLGEVGRHTKGRGVLFAYPGGALDDALHDGLEALRGMSTRTEIVVVGAGEKRRAADSTVTWISAERDLAYAPFMIRYGSGPAYAFVRDTTASEEGTRFFHTSDRSVVEHLAMRLQLELAVPQLL